MMYSRIPQNPLGGGHSFSHERSLDEGWSKNGVYVPLNYSGTAIGTTELPTHRFDDSTRMSDLLEGNEIQPSLEDTDSLQGEPEVDQPSADMAEHRRESRAALPLTGKFLFGHGLGYEELFLLGLLMFLRGQGTDGNDGDNLPLALLLIGALLFCG